MKRRNRSKPGYASITCPTISNMAYNLIFTTKFNNSSILITIISCDYLYFRHNTNSGYRVYPKFSSGGLTIQIEFL
jgi:hypothetical protein